MTVGAIYKMSTSGAYYRLITRRINKTVSKITGYLEKYLPVLSVLFLILGVALAKFSSGFTNIVQNVMNLLINYYGYAAPIVIFFILTPSMIKIITQREDIKKGFTRYIFFWLSSRRMMACIFGAIFTAVVFGLPLHSAGDSVSLYGSVTKSFKTFFWMITHSTYFYALYLSAITVLLSRKLPQISKFMEKSFDVIEASGKIFVIVVPFFMMAVGGYIYSLPQNVKQQVNLDKPLMLHNFSVFGFKLDVSSPLGMLEAYVVGSLLVGLACMIWHCALLMIVKYNDCKFSISAYFKNYWSKVYPLLWATSSESLATPLNLYLVGKYYPKIHSKIRGFIIGAGSFLNINGTFICVFLLAGLVASILGIKISLIQLLMCIPIVFLLGYGVPGIPGELLIFAGPIMLSLAIPHEFQGQFLALYLGLQLGLPDSFRTGTNSTDNCVLCILADRIYKTKFELPPVYKKDKICHDAVNLKEETLIELVASKK